MEAIFYGIGSHLCSLLSMIKNNKKKTVRSWLEFLSKDVETSLVYARASATRPCSEAVGGSLLSSSHSGSVGSLRWCCRVLNIASVVDEINALLYWPRRAVGEDGSSVLLIVKMLLRWRI